MAFIEVEKVERTKPAQAIAEPAIPTGLHPNLFTNAPAMGAENISDHSTRSYEMTCSDFSFQSAKKI